MISLFVLLNMNSSRLCYKCTSNILIYILSDKLLVYMYVSRYDNKKIVSS